MDDTPVFSIPGKSMNIQRIPLADEIIRVEALKLAIELKRDHHPMWLVDTATKLENYIRDGNPGDDEPGVWCIGPEESNQIMSIYSEGVARAAAEQWPETIYFFARLVT